MFAYMLAHECLLALSPDIKSSHNPKVRVGFVVRTRRLHLPTNCIHSCIGNSGIPTPCDSIPKKHLEEDSCTTIEQFHMNPHGVLAGIKH